MGIDYGAGATSVLEFVGLRAEVRDFYAGGVP
jgi:hypothetical protein